MNIEELYHFLFETMPGIGILVGGGLLVSVIVCLILERKTRKQFKNHEKTEDDWSLFDDDEEDESRITRAPARHHRPAGAFFSQSRRRKWHWIAKSKRTRTALPLFAENPSKLTWESTGPLSSVSHVAHPRCLLFAIQRHFQRFFLRSHKPLVRNAR